MGLRAQDMRVAMRLRYWRYKRMSTSTVDVQSRPLPAPADERPSVVNDFALVVATVNGSGSTSANATIIYSLFRMGIPVTGKNLFPSNISGLPTWYTVRLSKDGYVARREGTEILVAFNDKTAAEDLAALPTGGVCIYPLDWTTFDRSRDDVTYYGVPVKEFVAASGADPKLRDYVANMVYVGALMQLLGIERDEVHAALSHHFQGKAKATNLNYGVVEAAADWVRDNIV